MSRLSSIKCICVYDRITLMSLSSDMPIEYEKAKDTKWVRFEHPIKPTSNQNHNYHIFNNIGLKDIVSYLKKNQKLYE